MAQNKIKRTKKQKFLHGITVTICFIVTITLFAGFAVNMF